MAADPPETDRVTGRRSGRIHQVLLGASLVVVGLACACGGARGAYEKANAAFMSGDSPKALALANQCASRWNDRNSSSYWDCRLLAGAALNSMGRFREADAVFSEQVPATPPLRAQRARRLIEMAGLRINQRLDAAELLRQACEIGCDGELAIRAALFESGTALNLRQNQRAQERALAALDLARQQRNEYYEAGALNNLCFASRRLNRWEESIEHGNRAVAIAERIGARRFAAVAHSNLGPSCAYLGRVEEALQHEQKAIELNQIIGSQSVALSAIGELAAIYDRFDRVPEAIPQFRRAIDLSRELGLKRDEERYSENLALALIKDKQWDSAAEWNNRAEELTRQLGAADSLPYLVQNRAAIAWGRGQSEEAERMCREMIHLGADVPNINWYAHEMLGEIQAGRRRYPEANREFDSALRVIDATRSDLLDPRNRVTLISRLIAFYREYVYALVKQGDDAKALQVADSSRARVLTERLGRDVPTRTVGDPAALRASARAANVALLSFWLAGNESYAWLVTSEGIRRFDLPPASEIEKLVTAYRDKVEHSVADPLTDPSAGALWDRLMREIARAIPRDTRLVVIPDGPLHRLNLETLVVPGPRPHYWVEDVEMSVSPSIAVAMSKAGEPRPRGSLLAIGAPDYTGTDFAPLPGAQAEIEDLRKRFPTSAVFTGAQASPLAYRAAHPENFSMIHFAAHALANTERPLESAVVLSHAGNSFKLFAQDVIDVPIQADFVTLSACRSAGARAYAGEGLIGFAWAFLHAGARAVVAGLWDVPDSATRPLMAKFYEGIAAGQDTSCALRNAKLDRVRAGRRAFDWGAFQTYTRAVGPQ